MARQAKKRQAMSDHELMQLKQTYGMSAAAMLMRLRDVGILDKSSVDYAFRIYARSWLNDEPSPIKDGAGFGAFEKPLRFELLVYRALAEDMITSVRAAQFLKISLAEVEAEMRGWGKRKRFDRVLILGECCKG